MMLFKWGWFTDPLMRGDYPEAMKQHFGDTLPSFTAQEKQLLKGSADFVGVNTYTSRFIAPGEVDGMVRATQHGQHYTAQQRQ
jgi:beta-glucosidase